MRFVSSRGMVVDRHGAGPAVLLVHGVGGPLMWEKLVPLLARSRDVVVPHLPGFGDSPAPEKAMSSDDHAAGLLELAGTMGLDRISVVGVSYGGEIAARLAASSAGMVTRLVLVCPTGMWMTGGKPGGWLKRALVGQRFRTLKVRFLSIPAVVEFSSRRSFYDPANRPRDLVSRYLGQLSKPGHAEALFDALREVTVKPDAVASLLPELSAPVTIVMGENDRVIRPPAGSSGGRDATLQGVPGDVRILPGCGHSVPMEKPHELARIITMDPQ